MILNIDNTTEDTTSDLRLLLWLKGSKGGEGISQEVELNEVMSRPSAVFQSLSFLQKKIKDDGHISNGSSALEGFYKARRRAPHFVDGKPRASQPNKNEIELTISLTFPSPFFSTRKQISSILSLELNKLTGKVSLTR